jgi:transcription initiation factor IIE alpha subunit
MPPARLKELISSVGEERINICLNCPYHSRFHKTMRPDNHCTDCGCTLAAKTKCLSCECPKGKWKAIVDDAQEEQIKNIINGKEPDTIA